MPVHRRIPGSESADTLTKHEHRTEVYTLEVTNTNLGLDLKEGGSLTEQHINKIWKIEGQNRTM